MAALLCEGLGKLCNGSVTAISKTCCAPIKAFNNPFCITVTTALAFNIPPIAMSTGSYSELLDGCGASKWLLANTVFCAANIACTVYMAIKFKSPDTQGRAGYDRMTHILCQDPVVAIYILVLLGFFVWLCVGVSWRFGKMEEGCENYEQNNYDRPISTAIACGFSYFGVGGMALCCSICCSCCHTDRHDNTPYAAPNLGNNYASTSGRFNDVETPVAKNTSHTNSSTNTNTNTNTPTPIAVAVATPVNIYSEPTVTSVASVPGKDPNPSAPLEPSKVEEAKQKANAVVGVGLAAMKQFVNKKK